MVRIFGKEGETFSLEMVEVGSRVPKGPVLGPVLFSMYIKDVAATPDNKVSLYADDSKLTGCSFNGTLLSLPYW